MRIISIGSDRKLFKEGSAVRSRILSYGGVVDELHIIVFAKSSLNFKSEKIGENVWLYPTNSRSRFFYPFDAIKVGGEIQERTKQIDLVTAQDPFESGFAAWRIARRLKTKLQLQLHTDFLNPYFLKESRLNKIRVLLGKFLLPKADCVRVVSERIAYSLESANIKLRVKPTILPIFVDIKKIWDHTPRFDLHKKYPDFKTIIVMVSRLTKEKNISLAIKVMRSIVKERPETALIIVGEGEEKKKLKSLARRYKLENKVVFLPWSEDVISYYKTADLYLSTSNYEGYGMTFIEAAASDCSILTTDVGIARELFKESKSALICPMGDEECLKDNILKIIDNPILRTQMTLKAQGVLEGLHTADKEEYLKKYKESWEKCRRVR